MEAIKLMHGVMFKSFGEIDTHVYERTFKNWTWVEKFLEDQWQDESTVRALILIQGGKS